MSAVFPSTRGSALVGVRSGDLEERNRSFDALVSAYWKPVYKYLRLRWNRSPDEAQDITQGFFLRALEKDFFAPYDPARGRFRTFLRVCLDRYLANEEKAIHRVKRGGGATLLSLEFERADGELARCDPPAPETLDRCFDAEWARSIFELAVDALRDQCARGGKETHFRLFELYDLDDSSAKKVTYEELAARFGVPATSVTNHLAWSRREFRRVVLEKLREVTGSDEEFRKEARFLLGTEPK